MVARPQRRYPLDLTAMNEPPADNIRNFTDNGRDQRGRFASVPGNIGRPLGAKGRQGRENFQKLKNLTEKAFEQLCAALNRGDRWSVEFILNRVMPQSRLIQFEGLEVSDVKAALQNGDISSSEAKEISATLAKLDEITDLKTLRLRMEELEKLLIAQAG
jgi:hypothetical protein